MERYSVQDQTSACQQLYVGLLKAMRWSSQYCLFCLDVQILGHKATFLKGKGRGGGESWSYPKNLGMEGNKVYLQRCGEKGTRGAISKR